jgi:hypothetical protein
MKDFLFYETFDEVSDKQIFFNSVFVELEYPISSVSFSYENFELASLVVSKKFLGGFNDDSCEDRIIYLNDFLIENKYLFLWNEDSMLRIFVDTHKNILKKNNIFTINLKNKDQFEYIKHIVVKDYFKNL